MSTYYKVRWTEISQHERDLTPEELAEIKGVTVEELAEMIESEIEDGLADELAKLDDDGFEGLERDCIEVEVGA